MDTVKQLPSPSTLTTRVTCDPKQGHSRQEYFLGGKGGRYVGLTNLSPSCDECLEIWEPQPPGTLRALSGTVQGPF